MREVSRRLSCYFPHFIFVSRPTVTKAISAEVQNRCNATATSIPIYCQFYRPQLGVEACAGPFQVAKTRGDGYALPRTRHPMMMIIIIARVNRCVLAAAPEVERFHALSSYLEYKYMSIFFRLCLSVQNCGRIVRSAVVVYCHSKFPVMARFLFRAQDRNMTNGDFAFFTFWPARSSRIDQPWTFYSRFVDISNDLTRRRRAFDAVKQVHVCLLYLLFC